MKPLKPTSSPKQAQHANTIAALECYWSLTADQLLAALHTSVNGIPQTDAENRFKQYGPNALKAQRQATWLGLLLSQFKKC